MPPRLTARQLADLKRVRADLASGRAKRAREAAGIKQSELAAALGVAQCTVSLWESRRRVPGAEHALAYGRLLGRLTAEAA